MLLPVTTGKHKTAQRVSLVCTCVACIRCVRRRNAAQHGLTHFLLTLLRMRLGDGSVSEFDVERTGNPLARDRDSSSGGLLGVGGQMAGDTLSNSNDRLANSGAYVPPSLDTWQPPVIAVKTLQPGHTADDEDDI